jgi:hypothetical protein
LVIFGFAGVAAAAFVALSRVGFVTTGFEVLVSPLAAVDPTAFFILGFAAEASGLPPEPRGTSDGTAFGFAASDCVASDLAESFAFFAFRESHSAVFLISIIGQAPFNLRRDHRARIDQSPASSEASLILLTDYTQSLRYRHKHQCVVRWGSRGEFANSKANFLL